MVTVDLKSVYRVTAKGRVYHYAWKGAGAPRLLSPPGSTAYIQELAEALAARKLGDPSKISGLVCRFKSSDDYAAFADSTRKNWTRWLDRIQVHFGPLSVGQFDRPAIVRDIRRWRDKYKETPRTADYGLQVLSRVLSFAMGEGLLSANPCAAIPHLYRNSRSELIWTEADLAPVLAIASPEVAWAARLAVLTGIREGDLIRLAWSHVGPLAIEFSTSKSGGRRRVVIPLHTELRALLAEIPRRAMTVLTNTRERPWRTGFADSWGDTCKAAVAKLRAAGDDETAARIADRHFHDLRGTAATRLYLAGLNPREIAQVLGWAEDRVERMLDTYVKRDELMRDLIRRLDAPRSA